MALVNLGRSYLSAPVKPGCSYDSCGHWLLNPTSVVASDTVPVAVAVAAAVAALALAGSVADDPVHRTGCICGIPVVVLNTAAASEA